MRNVKIKEVEQLDREVVAIGNDYVQGFMLPQHKHRRAQLLYGATGLMHVITRMESGLFLHNMLFGSHPKLCTPSNLLA